MAKQKVKMARFRRSSFSVCLWKEGHENQGQYPAIVTEQAWLIKLGQCGFNTVYLMPLVLG